MTPADREAAGWLDKMQGPDADTHRMDFEAWRAVPENAKAYAQASDDWKFAGEFSRTRIEAPDDGERVTPGRMRWAFAAVLVVVIVLVLT